MERRRTFTSVAFSIVPNRCSIENLRRFGQIPIHIDDSIGQYPLTSEAERGHRCLRTNSPLEGANWFEKSRHSASPTSTFDPMTNPLQNGRMFSIPGLLIETSVREFVNLEQQGAQPAHAPQQTLGDISQTSIHLDYGNSYWQESRTDEGRRMAAVESQHDNLGCRSHLSGCLYQSLLGKTHEGLSKPMSEL
jgi:hypothetical protein